MGPKKGNKNAPKTPAVPVQWAPEQLSAVLAMLFAPDTAQVKQGETLLKGFVKHPVCITQLFTQIAGSPDKDIRHQAALLLRKHISKHFKSFSQGEQEMMKSEILRILLGESDRLVAVGVAGVVANLSKAVFAQGVWAHLFEALVTMQSSPNPIQRASTYSLLEQLAETIDVHLKPHMLTISAMLAAGCNDPDQQVKVSAMKAFNSFVRNLQGAPEITALEPVILPLLGVLQSCVAAGEDEAVSEGLEVLQEVAGMKEPIINNHIVAILHFIVPIMQNADCDEDVKSSATYTLISLIEHRPKLLGKNNMVEPILQTMVGLIAQMDGSEVGGLFQMSGRQAVAADGEEEEEDSDYGGEESNRNPQYILDTMALNLPSKYFVEPALRIASACMGSADPNQRKAGCFLLGVIMEGCADSCRSILHDLVPAVLSSMQDPEGYVREVACFTLGQMAEFCQPEILHYHSTVLPCVQKALGDPRVNVTNTSCYVLEFFCENLQPETLKPYMHTLLTQLCTLLGSPNSLTKEMALTAIAATAVAAEKDFLPFAPQICHLLHPIMFLGADQESLRGRSLECLGHIAVAIDREQFAPYFAIGMQSALQGLGEDMGSELLREHAFVFFANAGKVMGDGMAPFYPQLFQPIIDQINESELYCEDSEGSEDGEAAQDGGAAGAAGDEEEEDDDSGGTFRMADGKNSKKAAVTALGALAQHGGASFGAAMVAGGFKALVDNSFSIHPEVRSEILEVMAYFVQQAARLGGVQGPVPQMVQVQLPGEVSVYITTAMRHFLHTLKDEDEKSVVGSALASIGEIVQHLGLASLALPYVAEDMQPVAAGEELPYSHVWNGQPVVNILRECLLELLNERALCQKRVEEEDEDDADHDNVVMDQVSDLVGTLSKAMGRHFVPFFDQFANPLLKFTRPQRSHADRSMAIGCFAEVIHEIGPDSTRYIETLLPILQAGLEDKMEGVRRNCAYCINSMVQSAPEFMKPHFMGILKCLGPLCTRDPTKAGSDVGGADIDNAISTVATMIIADRSSIPLSMVLPVLLSSLPLRADIAEGRNVFTAMHSLLNPLDASILGCLPQLLCAFGQVHEPESKYDEQTKHLVSLSVQFMLSEPTLAAAVTPASAQITDPNIQAGLQAAMTTPYVKV